MLVSSRKILNRGILMMHSQISKKILFMGIMKSNLSHVDTKKGSRKWEPFLFFFFQKKLSGILFYNHLL